MISSRQIKRLLIFDLFGISSLLLPAQLAGTGGGMGIWCILAGTGLAFFYLWMLQICLGRAVQDYLEYLAQLEHIRWCRYHYLNNWQQGMPKNGKHKDKKRRIHKDLVPYEELSEADREKDREKVSLLLSMKLR